MATRVIVQDEITETIPRFNNDKLCLQKVVYQYDNGDKEDGFRFMYRGKNGKLKAQRGQANIISIRLAKEMIGKASDKGW